MGHKIEGSDLVGYRVVDDEAGALTGRKKTAADALAAAGIAAPVKRAKAARSTETTK